MHEPWILAVLAAAGLVAGFLNTVAGAGSLLTLPALMLTGMPADIANATNRIAVVAQSAAGAVGFHRSGHLRVVGAGFAVACTLAGAAVGAVLATEVPERVLRYVLLGTMIGVGVLMWREPEAREGKSSRPEGAEPADEAEGRAAPTATARTAATAAALFFAGLYGGFIQAGVGLVLLAIFVRLLRLDVVRANALKVVVVGIFSTAALGVFVARGRVEWGPGLALAAGSTVGAYLAVRFSVTKGSRSIRAIVLAMVVVSCLAIVVRSRG